MNAKRAKTLVVALTLAVGLFGLASVTAQPDPAANVRAAIERVNEEFMTAVHRADVSSIVNLYTRDAEIFPPLGTTVHGRRSIEDYWQTVFDMGTWEIVVKTDEVTSFADVACEIGTYRLLDSSGGQIASGKYMTIWKQEDGRWKVHRDMGNVVLGPSAGRHAR